MKLTLGFSPCPNDTFIFDALIHQKVDTEGLEFEVHYEDVETLNQKALQGVLDITKLSYHAYAYVLDKYVLLDAGSALGHGVGPLLICKNPELIAALSNDQASQNFPYTVGIPGKYTTANFLLGLAYPGLTNKREMVFSEIEQALLKEEIDLGLIIHENRFTYAQKGLHKIMDLGDFWEQQTQSPIPLGGIVIRRDMPASVIERVDRVLRRSVEFALQHPDSGMDFIRSKSQEMDEAVIQQHINLYVNPFSITLGVEGRKAIRTLFDRANQLKIIPDYRYDLFKP